VKTSGRRGGAEVLESLPRERRDNVARFIRKWVLATYATLLEAEDDDGELTYEAFRELDAKVQRRPKRAGIPLSRLEPRSSYSKRRRT
jgi:hypothetical protein